MARLSVKEKSQEEGDRGAKARPPVFSAHGACRERAMGFEPTTTTLATWHSTTELRPRHGDDIIIDVGFLRTGVRGECWYDRRWCLAFNGELTPAEAPALRPQASLP